MFDGVASHDEILPDFTTPSPFHLFVFASHFACVNKRALSLDLSGKSGKESMYMWSSRAIRATTWNGSSCCGIPRSRLLAAMVMR